VAVDLDNVLSGIGVWRLHVGYQHLVDNLSVIGVDNMPIN